MRQVAGRRAVQSTASGLCQRFRRQAVEVLLRLLQRLTQVRLRAEAAPVALLWRVRAVIVEESSRISLPEEVAAICSAGTGSQAGLKLFVRWHVRSGEVHGPLLTDGCQADAKLISSSSCP